MQKRIKGMFLKEETMEMKIKITVNEHKKKEHYNAQSAIK